jgi:hypothetical protein
MKRVTYAGETFRTTDEVADALFDLVTALDRGSAGESVELPAFALNGATQLVRLIVWPGSELLCVDEQVEVEPVASMDAAAVLRERADRLRVVRNASFAQAAPVWSGMDLDSIDQSDYGREPRP